MMSEVLQKARDFESMTLYLNGNPVGEKTISSGASIAPADRDSLLVGRNNHSEGIAAGFYQMCSGYMDELKLYGKALPR